MSDQRMVDVELLRRLAGICASHRYSASESKLRTIISGPGVEPVATLVEPPLESMKDNFWITEEDAIRLSKLPYGTRLYLASQSAPVQAVPDGWQVVPKTITLEMQHAYFKVIDNNMERVKTDCTFGRYRSNEEAYRAMLAAAPQPPKEIGE